MLWQGVGGEIAEKSSWLINFVVQKWIFANFIWFIFAANQRPTTIGFGERSKYVNRVECIKLTWFRFSHLEHEPVKANNKSNNRFVIDNRSIAILLSLINGTSIAGFLEFCMSSMIITLLLAFLHSFAFPVPTLSLFSAVYDTNFQSITSIWLSFYVLWLSVTNISFG